MPLWDKLKDRFMMVCAADVNACASGVMIRMQLIRKIALSITFMQGYILVVSGLQQLRHMHFLTLAVEQISNRTRYFSDWLKKNLYGFRNCCCYSHISIEQKKYCSALYNMLQEMHFENVLQCTVQKLQDFSI